MSLELGSNGMEGALSLLEEEVYLHWVFSMEADGMLVRFS